MAVLVGHIVFMRKGKRMKNHTLPVILLGMFLGGCSCVPVSTAPACQPSPVASTVRMPAPVESATYTSQKILAVGYGAMGGAQSQYTVGQQKLMAIRAAKVDAYRNLAEQVYGFRVWGNTAVSAFVTQNDNVRTYVDSLVRGARVVNITPVADNNYEATVELELTPAFFNYLSSPAATVSPSAVPTSSTVAGCANIGCVQPSGYYYTN